MDQYLTVGVGVCFSFIPVLTRVGLLACSSQFTARSPLCLGSPGSPVEMSITKTGSMLSIQWTPGETGAGHVTGYVIEARPSGTALYFLLLFSFLFFVRKVLTTYQYYQVIGPDFCYLVTVTRQQLSYITL